MTLTHPFQIVQFELTQREWVELGFPQPWRVDARWNGNVTWFEAFEFANRYSLAKGESACYVLSQCTGRGMICDGVRSGGSSVHDCDATGAEWDGRAAVGIA